MYVFFTELNRLETEQQSIYPSGLGWNILRSILELEVRRVALHGYWCSPMLSSLPSGPSIASSKSPSLSTTLGHDEATSHSSLRAVSIAFGYIQKHSCCRRVLYGEEISVRVEKHSRPVHHRPRIGARQDPTISVNSMS